LANGVGGDDGAFLRSGAMQTMVQGENEVKILNTEKIKCL